jgi:hypothetical protein
VPAPDRAHSTFFFFLLGRRRPRLRPPPRGVPRAPLSSICTASFYFETELLKSHALLTFGKIGTPTLFASVCSMRAGRRSKPRNSVGVEPPEGSRSLEPPSSSCPMRRAPPRPAGGGGGGNRNLRSPVSRDRRGLGSPSVSHRGNEIICTSIVWIQDTTRMPG